MIGKIAIIGNESESGSLSALYLALLNSFEHNVVVIDSVKEEAQFKIDSDQIHLVSKLNIEPPPVIYKKEDERIRRNRLIKNFMKNRKNKK